MPASAASRSRAATRTWATSRTSPRTTGSCSTRCSKQRPGPARAASSGRTTFTFTPDPKHNFNREFTDYFVNGRTDDIGAFDSPKNPGQADRPRDRRSAPTGVELSRTPGAVLHNGDGLCYYDLQKELVGLAINRASASAPRRNSWRVWPKDPMARFEGPAQGTEINRNRDMDWVRMLEQEIERPAHRRLGCSWAKRRMALR